MTDTADYGRLVQEQIAYYQARAGEYDEWFLRQGRYDHGPAMNEQWFREVEIVRRALDTFAPTGHILELACGTGLWTEHLLRYADQITAVDAATEALAINRARLRSSRVNYVQADIFSWTPPTKYDVVFFGFWLSHVPPEQFAPFWDGVAAALAPGGRVFLVDSRYDPISTASDQHLEGRQATAVTRRLNDGREFRIVKVFYDAVQLSARLAAQDWQTALTETEHHFLYGSASR